MKIRTIAKIGYELMSALEEESSGEKSAPWEALNEDVKMSIINTVIRAINDPDIWKELNFEGNDKLKSIVFSTLVSNTKDLIR